MGINGDDDALRRLGLAPTTAHDDSTSEKVVLRRLLHSLCIVAVRGFAHPGGRVAQALDGLLSPNLG
jgi:hypothetical protein